MWNLPSIYVPANRTKLLASTISPFKMPLRDVKLHLPPITSIAGSKVVTDGEQERESLAIYPIHGPTSIAADGIPIPFADGRDALCLLTTLATHPATIPS
jgi:hypothetical protein